MSRRTRRDGSQGQSLIEVLITVLFIGIGVLALIRLQNYLAYDSGTTEQRSDATRIADTEIETLRDFQVINNTAGYTSYQGIATGSSVVSSSGTSYSVSWTVTPYVSPTYKTINVTVSWTDRYNTAQSVNMIANVAGIDPSSSSSIM